MHYSRIYLKGQNKTIIVVEDICIPWRTWNLTYARYSCNWSAYL